MEELVPTDRGLSLSGIELDYDGCASCAQWLTGSLLHWQWSFDAGPSRVTVTGRKLPDGAYLCSVGGVGVTRAVEAVINPSPATLRALDWCGRHHRWPPPDVVVAAQGTSPLGERLWGTRRG